MIPYAKHNLKAEDIMEVLRVLQGNAITQGTMIDWFEEEFKKFIGCKYAVAVSSGTAALHAALMAAGISEGDEVIVPSMTFVATANVVKYLRAEPIFADIDEEDFLINPKDIEAKITDRTKAVIVVDYAGQPVDYGAITQICRKNNLVLIADACHSLGATYKDCKVGTLADLSCFSLHASKLITSGEGGVITTNSKEFYDRMMAFRNHGRVDGKMIYLGYNYRMTHLQAALCIHQIKRIPELVLERQKLASIYDGSMREFKKDILTIGQREDRTNARHIYVITTEFRDKYRETLESHGVGTQVHYMPITLQPFYDCPGATPKAEMVWKYIISIPLFNGLTEGEQETVIKALRIATSKHKKD